MTVLECFRAFYVTRSYIYPIYDCAIVLSCFLCNAVIYISYMTVLECFRAFYVTRSYIYILYMTVLECFRAFYVTRSYIYPI